MNEASGGDGIPVELFQILKDGDVKVLHSICQQTQDWEWTVAQIMRSLLPNSDLNRRKWGKPIEHSGMAVIKSLMIIQ